MLTNVRLVSNRLAVLNYRWYPKSKKHLNLEKQDIVYEHTVDGM